MGSPKILIVGSGSAGCRHYSYAKKLFKESQIEVFSQHSTPLFASSHIKDLQTAIDFHADLVIIANAAVSHLNLFSLLVKSDQLCVIEKPLSSSLNELENSKVLNSAELQNVMVAYQLRFSQSLLALKKEIESEEIGKILYARIQVGQYLPDWRSGVDYRKGVSARAALGGGVLNELSHEIDLLHWIFGNPKLIFSHFEKRSSLEIDVEDFSEFISKHSKLDSDHSWSVHVQLDMVRRNPLRILEVVGQTGTLLWDGLAGELKKYDSEKKCWATLVKDVSNPHELFWDEVKNFMVTRKHRGATFQESVSVLKFIEQIKSSNNKNWNETK